MTTKERFAVLASFVTIKPGTASVSFNRDKGRWEVTADVGTESRRYAKVWEAANVDEAVEVERLIN